MVVCDLQAEDGIPCWPWSRGLGDVYEGRGLVSLLPGFGMSLTKTSLREGGKSPRCSITVNTSDKAARASSDSLLKILGCQPSRAEVWCGNVLETFLRSSGDNFGGIEAVSHVSSSVSSLPVPQYFPHLST